MYRNNLNWYSLTEHGHLNRIIKSVCLDTSHCEKRVVGENESENKLNTPILPAMFQWDVFFYFIIFELSNEVCIIFQRRLLSMKRALAQTILDCSDEKCSPEPDAVLDTSRVSTIIAEFLQDAKKTDDNYVQMSEQLRQMRDEYVKVQ